MVATYREHGHALAAASPARGMMAEMFGKVEGPAGVGGGSMHLFDAATPLLRRQRHRRRRLPLAAGLALADRMQHRDRVTACFFGEGAVAEGEFHETMNLARCGGCPCCSAARTTCTRWARRSRVGVRDRPRLKAPRYGMPAWAVDGMDVLAVADAERAASRSARRRTGVPRAAHLPVPGALDVRPRAVPRKEEVERWSERDPIDLARRGAAAAGLSPSDAIVGAIEAEVGAEIDGGGVRRGRHARTGRGAHPVRLQRGAGMKTTYREAMREAIREALQRDERVFLMGEDVGRYGGCFAVSLGLLEEFGPERIRDTPLSESAFVGAGIGAALGGMRPIVEIMTVNFSLLALDQIVNNAATLLHMSGGQFNVPLVIRMTTGAGRQLAAQHSHSLEGWYAHVPGPAGVAPATLEDARGMLWTALADPDPVVDLRARRPLRTTGELADDAGPTDIDTPRAPPGTAT